MRFLQSLLDALLLGVHQLSVIDDNLWKRKSDTTTVLTTIAFSGVILFFLLTSIVNAIFLYNNTYGYYATDTNLITFLYIFDYVIIVAALFFYVYKYRGVELFDVHMGYKETIKCAVVVIVCVVTFFISAQFTRSQNIGYRVRTGWYERNPSKYAKMAKEIEDWKKEHPDSW